MRSQGDDKPGIVYPLSLLKADISPMSHGLHHQKAVRRYRLLASAIAGLLAALSLPPWGWWPLVLPACAIAYVALEGIPWKRRFLVGWVFGMGMFVPGLWWSFAFNVYGGVVLMVAESLFIAAAAAVVPANRARVVALPAAMVLAEYFRERWPFGGLPIGGIELGQAASPVGLVGRLGGPLLIVWLVWLAGAGIGLLVVSYFPRLQFQGVEPTYSSRIHTLIHTLLRKLLRMTGRADQNVVGDVNGSGESDGHTVGITVEAGREGGREPGKEGGRERSRRLAGLIALGVVVVVVVAGVFAPDGGPPIGHLRVAAIQGGGKRGTTALQVNPLTVFYAQVDATEEIPKIDKRKPPQLIVWPEDTVALDGRLEGSEHLAILQGLVRSLHATLEAGVTEPVGSTRFKNFSVAISPSGKIVSRYEKIHRVPFGEYVPYRSFFKHLASLKDIPRDAIPGHGPAVLNTPDGKIGIMISFETFFARRARAATRAGGRLLMVPTNTNSYANSQMPSQEIAASRLRAIEEGRDLVQAAPTGYSAIIDNQGNVMQQSALSRRTVLIGDVALRDGHTIYERFGDLPILVISIISLVLAWIPLEPSRRLFGRSLRRSLGTLSGDGR